MNTEEVTENSAASWQDMESTRWIKLLSVTWACHNHRRRCAVEETLWHLKASVELGKSALTSSLHSALQAPHSQRCWAGPRSKTPPAGKKRIFVWRVCNVLCRKFQGICQQLLKWTEKFGTAEGNKIKAPILTFYTLCQWVHYHVEKFWPQ